MKKLKNKAGETLGEVLVALLIVSLSFLILTGAVISAAKVNDKLKNEDVAFNTEGATSTDTTTIQIDGESVTVTVALHRTDNGYYYYD